MSDCGCDKALRDLEEFLRNEACHTDRADIAAHLADCPGCQEEALVARALTIAVARACTESAPEQLRVQVLSLIRASGG